MVRNLGVVSDVKNHLCPLLQGFPVLNSGSVENHVFSCINSLDVAVSTLTIEPFDDSKDIPLHNELQMEASKLEKLTGQLALNDGT